MSRKTRRHMRLLLDRGIPGSRAEISQHVERGTVLGDLIADQYGFNNPRAWKVKYVRWALERGLAGYSWDERRLYYCTACGIAKALRKWPDWKPYLNGPWICGPDCRCTHGYRANQRARR